MRPTIVIPTYWADNHADTLSPGAYDHSTGLYSESPELDRCLSSLEKVRDVPRVILLVVCPLSATRDVRLRIDRIVADHPSLNIMVVTNVEASRIVDRVSAIAPHVSGEAVSLRGYGAIHNMGLAVAAILGHDAVIFIDDDEVVLAADFMKRALYGLGQETRQRLPIIAKSGYFYDAKGSPFADEASAGLTERWWTKRAEFNKWMKKALSGTRICRSNYVCGGCLALHARAYSRVAFDPYITRGEDLDYLFNMRLMGYDVWFDNTWAVKHLPPDGGRHDHARFMQNVYRWYYERAKLSYASRQKEYSQVTPSSLMPYPGPWISHQLDERVRKTSFARAVLTGEHAGYLRIWRHGREDAERYACDNAGRYFKFISFWPSIMNGLWNDSELKQMLERS